MNSLACSWCEQSRMLSWTVCLLFFFVSENLKSTSKRKKMPLNQIVRLNIVQVFFTITVLRSQYSNVIWVDRVPHFHVKVFGSYGCSSFPHPATSGSCQQQKTEAGTSHQQVPANHTLQIPTAAPNLAWTFFAVLWFRTPQTKKDYSSTSRSSKLNQVFTFRINQWSPVPSHYQTTPLQSEVAVLHSSSSVFCVQMIVLVLCWHMYHSFHSAGESSPEEVGMGGDVRDCRGLWPPHQRTAAVLLSHTGPSRGTHSPNWTGSTRWSSSNHRYRAPSTLSDTVTHLSPLSWSVTWTQQELSPLHWWPRVTFENQWRFRA